MATTQELIKRLRERTEVTVEELKKMEVQSQYGNPKDFGKEALWSVYFLFNSNEYSKLENVFKH